MLSESERVWAALLESRDRAFRVARSRCGDADEAEDCVQEAMARVAAMPHVDPDRVGPLVTTVIANLAVDRHRASTRALRAQHRLSADPLSAAPEDSMCEVDEARWLWAQRASLGEQDRRVLELRVQGLTLSETAAELGVTYKAAENALGRARKRLRAAWAATAAVLGVLWGRTLRQPAPVVAAVPVTVLATAALVLLAPAEPAALTQPRLEAVTTPADAVSGGIPPTAAPEPPAGAEHVPAPVPPAPPTPPADAAEPAVPVRERVFETGAVEVLEHQQVSPATVEYHDDGESLLDEIRKCVEEGPRLTGPVKGCPP